MSERFPAIEFAGPSTKGEHFFVPTYFQTQHKLAGKPWLRPMDFLSACSAPSQPCVLQWPFWFETGRPEQHPRVLFQKVQIHSLNHRLLSRPIDVVVEPDGDGFIAKTPELADIFGFGDAVSDAIDSLKREVESLHRDLEEDDNFTPDWLRVKAFLRSLVLESRR